MPKLSVDAGHGLKTPGKRTPDNEHEWSFNNKVLLACVDYLKDYDIDILRLDDPTGQRDVPLKERTDKANKWGSELLISFHHNAYRGVWGNHTGTSTYIHTHAFTGSQKLAQLVQPRLVKAYGLANKGIKRANFHMLREHNASSILIEGAFMDSTIDIQKMRDDSVLREAGIQVGKAVLEYFGIEEKKGTPIFSEPTATVEQAQAWAKSKGASETFIHLAPIFWKLGKQTGVNPVGAYAQSGKETAYGNFGGVLDETFKNTAGIKTTSGGGNYDQEAHQRFDSWEQGVQAQLDHLGLYAGVYKEDSPDPRHFEWIKGKAPTFESLSGNWAGSSDYGPSIVRRMKEMESMEVVPDYKQEFNERVQNMVRLGISDGSRLSDNVTREEHLVMMDRLREYLEKDPS